jgi:WhiB family transcriptional regulator, redox-sensing transcriptional regulator
MTRSMPPMRETETVMQVRMSSRSALRQNAAEWDRESVLDLLDGPEWKERAACKPHPQAWWFPAREGNDSKKDYAKARAICGICPIDVRMSCFNHAVDLPEKVGMWAGTTPRERQRARLSSFARNTLAVAVRKADWDTLNAHTRDGRDYRPLRSRCLAMHREGMAQKDIAIELGVAPSTVSNWIVRGGR